MPELVIPEAPLSGIVVVELGHSVAAPYAGMVLADLGAEVIKIENPDGGDYARGWAPPFWQDTASVFAALNRGKSGMTVDFADPEDAARLRDLIVERADVVIQNLRPGLLRKYGLSGEAIRQIKPSLIWCDIGAFGDNGPLASKPGYDPLVQASSGIMSVTGEGGRPPVRVGVSIVDMGSGLWSVIGILAALYQRRSDGKGVRVGTSLYETGLAWMTTPIAGFVAAGDIREPYGSGAAEIVPYQAFEVSDGWLMVAAGNDNLFAKLVGGLGMPGLAEDERFRTNPDRVRHRAELIEILSEKMAGYSVEALGGMLDQVGVPNAPLLDTGEVVGHPQTEASGMLEASDGDSLRLVGIPLTFDGHRHRSKGRYPRLGEHDVRIAPRKPANE